MGVFDNESLQTIFTVLTLVATSAGWLFDRYVVRRRRLSYRVHWNRPVDLAPPVAHGMDLSITHGGAVVQDPSLVALRVENVGSFDVDENDVEKPLTFAFGGRRIVHVEVQETEPADLADNILRPRDGGAGPELLELRPGAPDAVLRLPAFPMARKARFKLLVLLSGPGTEVTARARLSGGGVVREGRRGARSRSGLVLGGASLLLGGLLVGLLATRDAPAVRQEAISCPPPGRLSVTGSTALGPVVEELAADFRRRCPGADVQVDPTSSEEAVAELVQGARADAELGGSDLATRAKLAMTDEHPGKPPRDPRLASWHLGVAAFAVVVNAGTGVNGLTSAQVRDLYAGRYPRWDARELGGDGRDVVLVSREPGSGTRDVFQRQVLGAGAPVAPISSNQCVIKDVPRQQAGVMHCPVDGTGDMLEKVSRTPGAIGYATAAEAARWRGRGVDVVPLDGYSPVMEAVAGGRYRFWAVEKLVRYGPERQATVRDHFVRYLLTQGTATRTLRRNGFWSCTDPAFLDGVVAAACAPDAARASPPPAAAGG